MTCPFDNIGWWITAIEIPVITALFALFWQLRQNTDQQLRDVRDILAAHRIEAVRSFAHHSTVRELEGRLTSHLLRIEAKLDITAIKAEIIYNQENASCEKN